MNPMWKEKKKNRKETEVNQNGNSGHLWMVGF